MYARASSGALIGVEAHDVIVESHRGKGLPGMALIGLARGAVRESLVRVRSAILASGYTLPTHRLVVNLLPAELPKEASALDLALAASLLAAGGIVSPAHLLGRRFFGELSLGGALEPVCGAILAADLARRNNDHELIVSAQNAQEAAVIPGINVIGVENIRALIGHLTGATPLNHAVPNETSPTRSSGCLSDVAGQTVAKRALEICSAGGHNLLMVGPPGSGKTMLARRLPSLLSDLTSDESIEVTRIHSAAGLLNTSNLVRQRPFRAPHHTASQPALCGGGSTPRPGEITLAHRGVLFLDELPEFERRTLETLREPLEEGHIHISRANWSIRFPAEVMLIAAMNPCPCGRFRDNIDGSSNDTGGCLCSFQQIQRYRGRISGPLLDRIDIHVRVDAVPFADYAKAGTGEKSSAMRPRINKAIKRQGKRLGQGRNNASMSQADIRKHVPLGSEAMGLLQTAICERGLSARAIGRILKVARTIADLEGESIADIPHVQEAINFRILER